MSTIPAATYADDAKSVRISFVEHFGEEQACAMEDAALSHGNGINDEKRGSDPFKWVCAVVIGYECAKVDRYREHHRITAPWAEIHAWLKEHAGLATHDGDIDYLCMFGGGYNEYMGAEPSGEAKAEGR